MSEEIEVEAIGVEVSTQPIELYKVLKIANVVSGGGEAKYAISEGYVAVNGELELRKRCKMYDGDVIEFNGEFYVVLCDQPVQEKVTRAEELKSSPKAMPKKANKSADKKSAPKANVAGNRSVTKKAANKAADVKPDTATGRKPISF
ncbi:MULTISPECIES: RNA-binding S4 domain-containing protein [unclassified Photobacterium]|uniref:RNA-binding S4 domain-containing protein n=1 Tax=unclassified Photobacterium TaxID=2628852 RepID=UPI001EDF5618|nr:MULTISPECIES: RNA-binding S4 domain-containing protein [unclassified Photobacterium]MCG3864446.1 RNA-binding S4 domain-containing protein [Photobacterium sp. Ph6]MCG3875970.1 RNA-binding S4 domain-containing protein [Photobacterium sp. Ph5]